MPRWPRITLPGVAHHLIQRGNNRQACFYTNQDYQLFLNWLKEYADESSCQIHAYVLMTNQLFVMPARKQVPDTDLFDYRTTGCGRVAPVAVAILEALQRQVDRVKLPLNYRLAIRRA